MGTRLLFLVLLLAAFSSVAFAGPSVVISDPGCNINDISLGPSGTYAFTYTGSPSSFTFCNTTSNTFTSLNFTITAPANSTFDLSGFYCGSPEDTTTAAFDYCLVLDPKQTAPAGQNAQLYGNTPPLSGLGGQPQELVVHQFVTSYPVPVLGGNHDTPSNFYQHDQCFFGCPTTGSDMSNEVHLSFDLLQDPGGFRALLCKAQIPGLPCGLLANHEFTLNLGCDEANVTGNHPCTPLPPGSGIALQAFTGPDQVTFPTPVPEPATLTLLATAAIPALLRRRKKR